MMQLVLLYWEFFKTGLFAIGGGLATLPFLYEMSAKTGWFTVDDISNLIAVSESTPGPMGVNMATYTGFTTAGIPGALIASLGLITPSVIIIILVSQILEKFKTNKYVQYAFYGLRAASTALIAVAGCSVAKVAFLNIPGYQASRNLAALFSWKSIVLALVIYVGIKKWNKHPILYILIAAIAGILFRI